MSRRRSSASKQSAVGSKRSVMMRQVFVTGHTINPLPGLAGPALNLTKAQGEGCSSGATSANDHSSNANEKLSYPQWSSHFGLFAQPAGRFALVDLPFFEPKQIG